MDLEFAPGGRACGLVIALDKGIDVFTELSDASEAGIPGRLSAEHGEPAFDLVEPGGAGWREVEINVLVAGAPASRLGLWVEIARMTRISHPGQAATMRFMKSRNWTRRRL